MPSCSAGCPARRRRWLTPVQVLVPDHDCDVAQVRRFRRRAAPLRRRRVGGGRAGAALVAAAPDAAGGPRPKVGGELIPLAGDLVRGARRVGLFAVEHHERELGALVAHALERAVELVRVGRQPVDPLLERVPRRRRRRRLGGSRGGLSGAAARAAAAAAVGSQSAGAGSSPPWRWAHPVAAVGSTLRLLEQFVRRLECRVQLPASAQREALDANSELLRRLRRFRRLRRGRGRARRRRC